LSRDQFSLSPIKPALEQGKGRVSRDCAMAQENLFAAIIVALLIALVLRQTQDG
jgi:hypothetical protein